MADEYSYTEELKQLVVTLAHKVADDPESSEEDLEECCYWLAGNAPEFKKALDEQRQQVSDAAPPR